MLPREGQPVQRPHDRVTLQDAQPVWRGFSHLQKRWGCCCFVPCHVHLPSTVIPGEGLLVPMLQRGEGACPGRPCSLAWSPCPACSLGRFHELLLQGDCLL